MEESLEAQELEVTYVCNVCQKTFAWKGNLSRHMKEVHLGEEKSICNICAKVVLKRHFHMHLKMQHGMTRKKEPNPNSSFVCPNCSDKFLNLSGLRRHAQEDHRVEQETEYLSFKDEAEFWMWKRATEKQTNASFVVKHGKSSSFGVKKQTFHCNRSGTYKPSGKNLRALKSQGTCKLGSYCTASIDVTFLKTEVQVTYHKTHFGHDLDVSDLLHVRIPETDKQLIAGRLMEGATMDDVLEELRESDTLERRALVDKKDLRNIIRKFGLDKRTCELCEFNSPNLASLRKHMAEVHARHQNFWCTQCRFKGTNRLALQKHRLKWHPRLCERTKCMETVIANGSESQCSASFTFFSRLRYHLAQAHGISIALEKETILCGSVNEFYSWKLGFESGTGSQYSSHTSKLVAGKTVSYKCTRTGGDNPEGEGVGRLKSQGSRKAGRDCTSEIRAELLEDGTVRATVFPFHYGHKTGAQRSRYVTVTGSEGEVVKEKLLHGLSRKRIIEEMSSLQAVGEREFLADKINRTLMQTTKFPLQTSCAGNVAEIIKVSDDSDQHYCALDAATATEAANNNGSHPRVSSMDDEDLQSFSVGGRARSALKVTSVGQSRVPGAPAVCATPDEGAVTELHRLRAEVAELRSTLRKTSAARDVERAELLSVFTPHQTDILLGRRALSDDWGAEDLRRAIALRGVLTRRQYEHLRLHLRLPLPEISPAAVSGQTTWEKRWLYRRLLDQRLAADEEQLSAGDDGGDTPPPGRLFVLRSMAEHGLQADVPEPKGETVQDDPTPMETHEVDGALWPLDAQTLDQIGAGSLEDRWEGRDAPKPARSRRLKVAITPGLDGTSHVEMNE